MVPLTITPRSVGATLGSTAITSVSAANQPIASVAQIIRNSNVNVVTTVPSGQLNSNNSLNVANNANSIVGGPTILPIAKVLPQQHQQSIANDGPTPSIVSVSTTVGGQSVFIHSRSPSGATVTPIVASNNSTLHLPTNSQNTVSFISSASGAYYVPTTVHANSNNSNNSATTIISTGLPTITTNATTSATNAIASMTTSQIITSAPITSIAYAPQAGSFAVVPASNRKSGPQHGK